MQTQFRFRLTTTFKAIASRKRPSDYVPKAVRDITMQQYLEKKLVWSLYRDQKQKSYIDFVSFGPAKKLTEQLTDDFIAETLNENRFLFDFDYTPTEGDLFNIKHEYVLPPIRTKKRLPIFDEYMTFIYSNEKWNIDRMNDENIYALIAQGVAEFEANN